jgi:cell division septum initiation protein DivIVA
MTEQLDIEALQKENEELKAKVASLLSQLRVANQKVAVLQQQVGQRYKSQQDYVPYHERD